MFGLSHKKCEGPCEGLVSEHKYSKMIKKLKIL